METLRYRGDCRNFDPDHILGPDMDRRRLRIVDMEYDPKTDVSTATLRAILPADFREAMDPLLAQHQARQRIWGLFNA